MLTSRHEPCVPAARAFTLVELLVVITLMALLIALLLPALASARKAGQTAVCGANIHQIMIAFVAYSNENAGYLPNQALPNLTDWSGTLAQLMASPNGFRCPEDANTRRPELDGIPWRSYAINSGKFTYLGNGYHSPWPPTSTDAPEKLFDVPNHVLLVGQNDGHDGINGPDAPDGAWDGITGVSGAVVGVAEFEGLDAYAWDLHPAKGVNYGFSDGSVRFLTRAYIDQWRADTDYAGDPRDPWKWKS